MRLTVKQLKNRDPGSGMAVIDREALAELGVTSGDFVAIEGRDGARAVARVWPSDASDAGRGIIRIDGSSGRRRTSASTTWRPGPTATSAPTSRRSVGRPPRSRSARRPPGSRRTSRRSNSPWTTSSGRSRRSTRTPGTPASSPT